MTYAIGGLIQAADYNGFASTGSPNVNNIWGVGAGSSGYGQVPLSTVAVGQTIAAAEWDTLASHINNSAAHQGTTITAVPTPSPGATIAYLSTVSAGLTAIAAGALNCVSNGTDITNTGTRVAPWGVGAGAAAVTSTITVVFGSANEARYFFNTGGAILLSCSRTGGVGTPEDLNWSQLCTEIGTLGLPAVNTAQSIAGASYVGLTAFGQTGSAPTIYIRDGFYNLTSTPTPLYKQYSDYSSYYLNDFIQVSYSYDGATTVTIDVLFQDTSSTHGNNTVTGSLSVTAIARPSESTFIASTWGTPVVTVSAPA